MTQTPFQKLLASKGIRESTAERWGVVAGEGDTAVYPYPAGRKIRGNISGNDNRTFKFDGRSSLYRLPGSFHRTVFICEGEHDTLRLWQEFEDHGLTDKISVVGLSGINGWHQDYAKDFNGVEKIRIVLDQDEDYSVRASVDKSFTRMATDLGRSRVRRIYLPDTPSDICTFFGGYSFRSFVEIAKPNNKTNYDRLDLSATPPVAEWLVEGLICKGDITLVTGPPNIGKSMVMAQGLALAVAEGWDHFLGQPLNVPPEGLPAMCIDKENPVDTVYTRLLGMGMTEKGMKNLHYFHMPDVRLDKYPEKLHDDAMIIKPAIITLDAITRMHSGEENDSGSVNRLFNEAIIPLGRESGAAVVVIHAVNKGDGSSSFNKIRGSSDFGYAIDNGIEISTAVAIDGQGIERDALELKHFKSRRTKRGARFTVFITEGIAGGIELEVAQDGF